MRAVVQRVEGCTVRVAGEAVGTISAGLLVFLGIEKTDTQDDLSWLVGKVARLRIFEDREGLMNLTISELPEASALVISQFTLFGNVRNGSRPSFNRAAPPDRAIPLYEQFADDLSALIGRPVPTGRFGAMMTIEAFHTGPVTIILDSHQRDF